MPVHQLQSWLWGIHGSDPRNVRHIMNGGHDELAKAGGNAISSIWRYIRIMINFAPLETPLGVPVRTWFYVRGHVYVVDMDGILFQLDTQGDNPDLWCWREVIQL